MLYKISCCHAEARVIQWLQCWLCKFPICKPAKKKKKGRSPKWRFSEERRKTRRSNKHLTVQGYRPRKSKEEESIAATGRGWVPSRSIPSPWWLDGWWCAKQRPLTIPPTATYTDYLQTEKIRNGLEQIATVNSVCINWSFRLLRKKELNWDS